MLKLFLRRSSAKNQKPTVSKPAAAGELAQGELWLNNNHETPGLFARADNDTLIEFKPGATYTLPTASATALGGIKVGTNLTIDATGILSAKVTGALVFKGSKDPTTAPPASPVAGDVYVMSKAGVIAAGWTGLTGTAVSIHELVVWDGAEWVLMGSAVETTVHTVTGTAPIVAAGTTAVTLSISDATAAAKGVVQLADAAAITAGTAGRVVDAAELKAAKYTLPTATAAALGGVKVGTNLSIDANGILSAKVTGALVFKGSKDPTAAAPTTPAPVAGDVYVMSKAGVLAASWTGIAGTSVAIHELVVFDGTEWVLMGSAVETTVHSITATAPLHAAGTTAVTMRIDDATAAAKGVVQLADAAAITAGTAGRVVDAAQLLAANYGTHVHVAETPPANPKQGDEWFHSGKGKLYVYYDDGTGAAQWVVASPQEAVDYSLVYKKAEVYSKTEFDAKFLGTKTASGYQKLPSGLIIQWAQVTNNNVLGKAYSKHSFPIAFPTALLGLYLTAEASASSGYNFSGAAPCHPESTLSTFNWVAYAIGASISPGAAGTTSVYLLAIGY